MVHLIYDSRCTSFEYKIAVEGYSIHGAGRIKIMILVMANDPIVIHIPLAILVHSPIPKTPHNPPQ